MEGEADIDAFVDSLFSDAGTGEGCRPALGTGGQGAVQCAAAVESAWDPPATALEHGASYGASPLSGEDLLHNAHGEDVPVVAGPGSGGLDSMPVAQCGLRAPFDTGSLFPFSHLNQMQSVAVPRVLGDSGSVVVAAPTGAGKTVVFEAAIAHAFRDEAFGGGRSVAVYVSPIKALAQERTRDWQRRLAQFGIRVAEATGDALPEEGVVALAREGRLVLCTTPEKLAVLTLNVQLVQRMALVLVDEIHILNDERGGVLEAALSRLLQAAATASAAVPGGGIRFVAASASIPNAEDIGEWLGCAAENVLVFGEECRPVPLSVHVETFPDSGNPFLFDRKLTPRVAGIVRAHSEGRPSLVFCATRKATVETARHLASAAGMKRELIRDHAHARRLQGVASSVSDTRLAELLRAGVGFHNADLGPADRAAVEDTFRAADLHVLCTTSTLAQGVNLPARLVVVKGTYGYRGAGVGFVPLPPSAVQQMIGRAGRPQYDAHGVAVIMSPGSIAHQYSASALARREPVESHLPRRLNEYVSAEVALGAIASVAEAESWLSRTFFRVRARRNPERYGLPSGPDTTQDRALAKVCGDCLAQLQGAGLIVRDGDAVAPTALGQITTRMYLRATTGERLGSLATLCAHGSEALAAALRMLASAEELEGAVKLRHGEKTVLNKAGKGSNLPFPPQGKVQTGPDKAFILLQLALRRTPLATAPVQLRQDLSGAHRQARRVVGAMLQAATHPELSSTLAPAVAFLAKAVNTRCWPAQRGDELMQLKGVGPAIAKKLAESGLATISAVVAADAAALERGAGRRAPWGEQVLAPLRRLRALALRCTCRCTVVTQPGATADAEPAPVLRVDATLQFEAPAVAGVDAPEVSPYTVYLTASVPSGLVFTRRVTGPSTVTARFEVQPPPGTDVVVLRATLVRSDLWWAQHELWDHPVARIDTASGRVEAITHCAQQSETGKGSGAAAQSAGSRSRPPRSRKRQATLEETQQVWKRGRANQEPASAVRGDATQRATVVAPLKPAAPAAPAAPVPPPQAGPGPEIGATGTFVMAVDEQGVMRRVRLMDPGPRPARVAAAAGAQSAAAASMHHVAARDLPPPTAREDEVDAESMMEQWAYSPRPRMDAPTHIPDSATAGLESWDRSVDQRSSNTFHQSQAHMGRPVSPAPLLNPRFETTAKPTARSTAEAQKVWRRGAVRSKAAPRISLRPSWMSGPAASSRPSRRVGSTVWPPVLPAASTGREAQESAVVHGQHKDAPGEREGPTSADHADFGELFLQ